MAEVEPRYVVEAALFSAGRPLSIEEIAQAVEMEPDAVRRALRALIREYGERPGSIEVAKVGTRYAIQLRRAYLDHAAALAQREIPLRTLKTAALVAYHQPIRQSDLAKMVGGRVYDHVRTLQELGLVRSRRDGQTKVLYTTARFAEYFGIEGTDKRGVKAWLEREVKRRGGAAIS